MKERIRERDEFIKESDSKAILGVKLIILLLADFLGTMIIVFMFFGLIDTYQFIVGTYFTQFWIVTIIIFAIIFILTIISVIFSRSM